MQLVLDSRPRRRWQREENSSLLAYQLCQPAILLTQRSGGTPVCRTAGHTDRPRTTEIGRVILAEGLVMRFADWFDQFLPMNEGRWLKCPDQWRMVRYVRPKVSQRKLRLFASGCFRQRAILYEARGVLEQYPQAKDNFLRLAEEWDKTENCAAYVDWALNSASPPI
jgi:hypothetical protein